MKQPPTQGPCFERQRLFWILCKPEWGILWVWNIRILILTSEKLWDIGNINTLKTFLQQWTTFKLFYFFISVHVCAYMCTCACVVPEEFIWGQWLSLVGVTGDCELSNIMVRSWTQILWESRKFSLLSQSSPAGILFIIKIFLYVVWCAWGQHCIAGSFLSSLHGLQGLPGLCGFYTMHHLTSSGLVTVNCLLLLRNNERQW